MQQISFRPGVENQNRDKVAHSLLSLARLMLIITLGLSPLLFIPASYTSLSYAKTFLIIIGLVLSIVLYCLAVLRSGTITLRWSNGLLAFWIITAVALVSALFSGDVIDSLYGEQLGIYTASFALLLAVVMTTINMLTGSKKSIIRLYALLITSALVLCVFHISRLIFGADFLAMGQFASAVATPLGSWNGLAIFFGLTLLLGLVAVEQLPLTKIGKAILGFVTICSLIMLAVVNFFAVWLVLGVVSLMVLIYSLTKHQFASGQMQIEGEESNSLITILLALAVLTVSGLFIIGGSGVGSMVVNQTGINYIEVRPSFSATVDIARQVMNTSPVLGIGPNKFVDAWRLYKDPNINQTIFWTNNFSSGSSYITTSIVNTGLLGLVAWLGFLLIILYSGLRLLFRAQINDRFWYFIGVSSFVATLYLWGMHALYVSSAAVLLLTVICTGIFLTTYTTIMPRHSLQLSIASNRNIGFVLVAGVMLVLIGAVGSLYYTSQHYTATHSFAKTISTIEPGDTLTDLEVQIANAYRQTRNDTFARQLAFYQLAQISALLRIPEPTEGQQQTFSAAIQKGITAGQESVSNDPTEPLNHQLLGQIYSTLAAINIEGAYEQAKVAIEGAQTYDPKNPIPLLVEAQLELRAGNFVEARAAAEQALALRPQYVEAHFLLSQLAVSEGNVAEAISRTESLIALEPQNASRYYQLGLLHLSEQNNQNAIAAFEQAIVLNENFANARYVLAETLVREGRTNEAITQLEIVRGLSPNNAAVDQVIANIRNGVPLTAPTTDELPVNEPNSVVEDVTEEATAEDFETNLVTPVNVVPDANEEAETAANAAPDTTESSADSATTSDTE